jgi:predicted O-methyltransferase YrrM
MTPDESKEFVGYAYEMAFHRKPSENEMEIFSEKLERGEVTQTQFLRMCLDANEFRIRNAVKSTFPMGHYHSPVVDPSTVVEYLKNEGALKPENLKGVKIDIAAMRELWRKHLPFTREHLVSVRTNSNDRFRYGDGPFPEGDALSLQLMFAEFRPRRVIEIGSGFSTACMLDSAERLGLTEVKITCIEPYPDRLQSLLRPTDKIELIQKPIQDVDCTLVDELEPNDILFIDSTHVMKTGSDVHFEFFYLLPRLKPGVVVHFHDVGFPFEYPNKWVFEFNYSWNEAYVLRAFMMYNTAFEIVFWNSLLYREPDVREEFTLQSGNPGSSIWLRRSGA